MAHSGSDPPAANRDLSSVSGSSTSRYRFRSDLEIVRNGSGDGTAAVTVLDRRSASKHVFSADEFVLCRAADGTNSLAAIQQIYKTQTGHDIALGKLFAFFRRLRRQGLLDEPPVTEPQAKARPAADPVSARESAPAEDAARDAAASAAATAAERLDQIAAPAPAVAAEAAGAQPEVASSAEQAGGGPASSLPPTPGRADAQRAEGRARRQRLMRARWRADKATALGAPADGGSSRPAAGAEGKTPTSPDAGAADRPPADATGRPAGDNVEEAMFLAPIAPGRVSAAPGRSDARRRWRNAAGAKAADAAGRRPDAEPGNKAAASTPRADQPVSADSADAGDVAGAFGGIFGAAAGGAVKGRDFRGEAVQKFLVGVAARARAREEEAETDSKEPARVVLFNPNALLGTLAALTRPLKYALAPLLLAVPATLWVAWQHRGDLAHDIGTFDASVVATVVLALVIISFMCRLTQGTLVRGFGAEVMQFGVALTWGVPRFFVDLRGIAALDRRGALWVYAAPLMARLGLFCAGTLAWYALQPAQPWPAHLALVVGQIALVAFLLSALPLLPSDGYRWLATYLDRPALRAEALGSLAGRPPQAAAVLYALAVVLALALLALVAQSYADVASGGELRPLTAWGLPALGAALAAWALALRNDRRGRQIEAPDAAARQQALVAWTAAAEIAGDRSTTVASAGKVFWSVLATALVAVAFLPYRYDPTGAFAILPAQRTVVAVRTAGEVEQVLVREGDWVKANQPLAKLSSDDQQREIAITRAELERAKAQLAQFGDKADKAQKAEMPASDPGVDALERSIADAFSDEPGAAVTKKSGADGGYFQTQAERAARADVERLTRKLAYDRDQLANTTVRAPKEGRVVTPNVHLLTGTFLRRGAELLSLADTRQLEAEISLPEADIAAVKVGDKVRLRPWSNDDREIEGTVSEIAPAAQARPFGMIVRVRASIPNQDAVLRPAMTGYAKIDGEEMRVWQAFLGRIVRFVRVEMWSWIP
jgi:multidrug efflux pump subunit AcrA (membrane-fusion protein)